MLYVDGMILDSIEDLPAEVWEDDFGFIDWE